MPGLLQCQQATHVLLALSSTGISRFTPFAHSGKVCVLKFATKRHYRSRLLACWGHCLMQSLAGAPAFWSTALAEGPLTLNRTQIVVCLIEDA